MLIFPNDLMFKMLFEEHSKFIKINKAHVTTYIHNKNMEHNNLVYQKKIRLIKIINYLLNYEKFKKTKKNILYLKINAYLYLIKKKFFIFLIFNIFDFIKSIIELKIIKYKLKINV